MLKTLLAGATALTLLSGAALAADSAKPAQAAATAGQAQLSEQDRTFAKNAAEANMAEIQLGELAQDKAQNQSVKQYGAHMVQDHTLATQQMTPMAEALNIELPDELKPEHKQAAERLSGLSGAEFDRAYMQQMVKDHQMAIELFQKQAQDGQNAQLKQFAQQTLPKLQDHLRMAEEITQGDLTAERPAKQ